MRDTDVDLEDFDLVGLDSLEIGGFDGATEACVTGGADSGCDNAEGAADFFGRPLLGCEGASLSVAVSWCSDFAIGGALSRLVADFDRVEDALDTGGTCLVLVEDAAASSVAGERRSAVTLPVKTGQLGTRVRCSCLRAGYISLDAVLYEIGRRSHVGSSPSSQPSRLFPQ
jgi:hypothetical protein